MGVYQMSCTFISVFSWDHVEAVCILYSPLIQVWDDHVGNKMCNIRNATLPPSGLKTNTVFEDISVPMICQFCTIYVQKKGRNSGRIDKTLKMSVRVLQVYELWRPTASVMCCNWKISIKFLNKVMLLMFF